MNYLDQLAAAIQLAVDPESLPPDADRPLYRLYAVLLLAKGEAVTAEDVHSAWAAWASEHEPESRHLVPFKELPLDVQHRDQAHVDAIRRVAASGRLSR